MDRLDFVSFVARIVVLSGAYLCLAAPAPAAEGSAEPGASVTVFPAHYASGGRAFGDLEALASTLATDGRRAVRLEACGPASIHPLLAAAHRLRHARLDMRVSADDDPACRAGAIVPVGATSAAVGQAGAGNDAVERYWRLLMP